MDQENHFQVSKVLYDIYYKYVEDLVGKSVYHDNFNDELEMKREEIFQTSLETAWGTLPLIAFKSKNLIWWHEHRYKPLLQAALRYWDLYENEGPRFSNGLKRQGDYLWNIPTTLRTIRGSWRDLKKTLNRWAKQTCS